MFSRSFPHLGAFLFVLALSAPELTMAQSAIGSLAIRGIERSTQVAQPATPGSAVVTIQGLEQSIVPSGLGGGFCEIGGACPGGDPIFDSGLVSITVNGYTAYAFYGSTSTSASIAADLASGFNLGSTSPISAGVADATLTLVARTPGQSTNYALSTSASFDSLNFSFPSFDVYGASTALSGGQDAGLITAFDSGSLTANISGYTQTVSYGQNDTAASLATRLADAINADCNSLFIASTWADESSSYLDFQFKQGGAAPGFILSPYSASNDSHFSGTSFPVSVRPMPPTNYVSVALPSNAVVGSTCERQNAWRNLTPDQQASTLQQMQTLMAPQVQKSRQDMQAAQAQFGVEGGTDSPFAHHLVNVSSSSFSSMLSFVDESGMAVSSTSAMVSTNAQQSSKAPVSPTMGVAPLTVTFFNPFGTFDHWDFGDGQTSTSTHSFVHIYQSAGIYTAIPYYKVTRITRTVPPSVHTTVQPGTPVTIAVFVSNPDQDHDGLFEQFEGQLADSFTPLYHVSAGEQPGTGFATFLDQVPQTVAQTFGPLPPRSYFRVTPLGFATINGRQFGFIEIDYLTLWNRDDGLIIGNFCRDSLPVLAGLAGLTAAELADGFDAHRLDNERSGFLVAAPTTSPNTFNPDAGSYGAYSVFFSAHEGTFTDHSQYFTVVDAAHPLPPGNHVQIWLSRSKHASYPSNPNGNPLTPTPIIDATYATLSFLLAIGEIDPITYLEWIFRADDAFFSCLVEHFTEQGGSIAQPRINLGEINAPLNGSSFIDDPEPGLGLLNKLSKPLWLLQ